MQYTQEQKDIVKYTMNMTENLLIEAGAGSGKEQPLTSKVLTPNGWVQMGDLKVGDKVCSPNKTYNTVQAIFPQGIKDVYEVHFSDGSIVECGLDHLWRVNIIRDNTSKTLSVKDMLSTDLHTGDDYMYSVPLTEVKYSKKTLPMNPYLLGSMLRSNYVGHNSISQVYLEASIKQRKELLKGLLLDQIGNYNDFLYVTTHKKLASAIVELVKSLGIFCTLSKDNGIYTIHIQFKERKYITKIVKTDKAVKQQCIALDGDNLYITDGYTTTHNTTILFNIFRHLRNKKFLLLSFNKHLTYEYAQKKKKYKLTNVDAMTLHKLAKAYTLDVPKVLIHDEWIYRNRSFYEIVPFIHATELQEITGENGWKVTKLLNNFCKSKQTFKEAPNIISNIFKFCFRHKRVTHDMYLKLFQLGIQNGSISLKNNYDFIALDECQDMRESIIDLFINVDIPHKIVVGDEYQAILGFLLEGYNAFRDERLLSFKRLFLTQSFRCSPEIANKIDKNLLKPFLHSKYTFKGNPNYDKEDTSVMLLARTNNEVLWIAYKQSMIGKKFILTADLKEMINNVKSLSYVLSKTYEIENCYFPKELKSIIPNVQEELFKDILMYINREDESIKLSTYLKEYSSPSVKTGFTLLNKLEKADLTITEFEETIKEGIDKKSNIKISNVHLVKGSEAGTVHMYMFKDPYTLQRECIKELIDSKELTDEEKKDLTFEKIEKYYTDTKEYRKYIEELYILYVAMSRAKHTLKLIGCGENRYWRDDANKYI